MTAPRLSGHVGALEGDPKAAERERRQGRGLPVPHAVPGEHIQGDGLRSRQLRDCHAVRFAGSEFQAELERACPAEALCCRATALAVLKGCSSPCFVWEGTAAWRVLPRGALCCARHLDVFAWQTLEGMAFKTPGQPELPTVGSSPVVVNALDPPPREGCEPGSSAEPLPEEGLMCS